MCWPTHFVFLFLLFTHSLTTNDIFFVYNLSLLNITYNESQITNHESQITNHESQVTITNNEAQILNHESRVTNKKSRIINHIHESQITDIVISYTNKPHINYILLIITFRSNISYHGFINQRHQ